MKGKVILLVFLLSSGLVALACLNEHHLNKKGSSTGDHFELGSFRLHKQHNKAEIGKELDELLKKELHNAQDTLWNQNSIAVNYIKLGKLDEAETVLSTLIKKYPNDYYVVVNMGTLFELQGKNKQALQFIKRAMTIDPKSHHGSEWFHIKVLEFKLKNIPGNRIVDQDILGLSSIKELSGTIAYQVSYQLQERIPFTPAPNLAMAKILQEYGDYLADSVSIKGAYVIYEIGMEYDSANLLKLGEKRNALLPYFKKYKEAIPLTKNYYLDNIISTVTEVVEKDPVSIIEKGFDFFNEQGKKEKEKKRRRTWVIIAGIALVSISVFLLNRKGKKTEV